MALKFGTSGVRGLVTEMTDQECFLYACAYARYLKSKTQTHTVSLAGDLRNSTPRIMGAVAAALRAEGLHVDNCGFISTPAVTYHGMGLGQASVMVTGSHIPDDRNGIKFNMPWGEVLKDDESEISARYLELSDKPVDFQGISFKEDGSFTAGTGSLEDPQSIARVSYVKRYLEFYADQPLSSMNLVFYEHSTVCRDFFIEILEGLGAKVRRVGRSDTFVPVDTEAVREPERLAAWVSEFGADALVTADGDGDRPLLVDEQGTVVRGDVLGILVSGALGARSVATPVSCNTALEKSGLFENISRTRIGSPYVIEAMNVAVADGPKPAVGYEANGGFLTATDISSSDGARSLTALPSRDAVLPILAVLIESKRREKAVSELVASLPSRFTWSGLQRGVPNAEGKALVARFNKGGASVVAEVFGETFGEVEALDFTDGARLTFISGDVVHLRPSGNAPEFRCYTESGTEERAKKNNETALAIVKDMV